MKSNTLILLFALAVPGLSPNLVAQSGSGFEVTWSSADGGGETSVGGGFSVHSSSGQADPGDLLGGTFNLDGGLWPGVCGGTIETYGSGCPGSGGFVPQFNMQGCPATGYDIVLSIENGLGGSLASIFLGLGPAALPMGAGCTLNVFPLLPSVINIPLIGAGAGNGAISFPLTVPASVPALVAPITLQVFVADGGAALGFSNSNGVQLVLG